MFSGSTSKTFFIIFRGIFTSVSTDFPLPRRTFTCEAFLSAHMLDESVTSLSEGNSFKRTLIALAEYFVAEFIPMLSPVWNKNLR